MFGQEAPNHKSNPMMAGSHQSKSSGTNVKTSTHDWMVSASQLFFSLKTNTTLQWMATLPILKTHAHP